MSSRPAKPQSQVSVNHIRHIRIQKAESVAFIMLVVNLMTQRGLQTSLRTTLSYNLEPVPESVEISL